MKKAHIIVHGQVQGVAFRHHTDKEANKLGLGGWVRNKSDGTVEVEAEGESGIIDSLIDWCRTQGSPASRVDRVDVALEPATGQFRNFSIRF